MPYYPKTTIKTIKYDSPSGKININKYFPPFNPVVGGYGFYGVLAEDTETGELQCHVCGEWHEQLALHITKKHKVENCFAYREEYGLFRGTALKSKRLRLKQSKIIRRLQKEGKMGVGNNLGKSPFKRGKANKWAANRKGWKKPVEGANQYGRCDLQIMNRILELSKKMGGKTPSLVDIKEEYGGGIISVMHQRYGSYIKYCRQLKLEPLRSVGNPWSEKEWKSHLIEVGKKNLKKFKGKKAPLKKLLPVNEQRYVYKHFKSYPDYLKQIMK